MASLADQSHTGEPAIEYEDSSSFESEQSGPPVEAHEVENESFDQLFGVAPQAPVADRARERLSLSISITGPLASELSLHEPRIYANRLLGRSVNTKDKIIMKNRNG